ncbi:MAG: hypothetical protein MJZ40_02530 [Bacteroidaceae bacterium]|nr:hypothetical protein [Bacteroidaceae bacterium]
MEKNITLPFNDAKSFVEWAKTALDRKNVYTAKIQEEWKEHIQRRQAIETI